MPPPAEPLAPHVDALYAAGGRVYEVGGAVRDRMLGRESKDADLLVTGVPVERMKEILQRFGAVHAVGMSFGVLKFQPRGASGEPVDVALPRLERSTGPGHRDFDVHFDHNLPVEADLGRRDFTVNAIAVETRTGEVVDPLGGRVDLEARRLRMVFPRAFEEDPLRILRGIQFAARFALRVEPETLAAMKRDAERVATVSSERIVQELKKLLLAPKPSVGFYLMREVDVLKFVVPELLPLVGVTQPGKKNVGDAFDHTMRVIDAARVDSALEHPGDLGLLLAALFHDVGKATTRAVDPKSGRITFHGHQFVSKRLTRRRLDELKVSQIGIDPNEVLTLVENHMFDIGPNYSDKALRRFAKKIGPERVFKQIDLRIADNRGGAHPTNIHKHVALRKRLREELEKKPPFGLKDLAIDGNDLLKAGYKPGPGLGAKLKELLELVLDDPSLNTRDELMKRI